MTTPDPHEHIATDTERRRVVEVACDAWIRRLIDYSRRNSLLFYRELKAGTLELTDVPGALKALLGGDGLRAHRLIVPPKVPESADPAEMERVRRELEAAARREVRRRLRAIRRTALSNLEEKGLETLYLAVGMATWPADDGGRPHEAPVLLVPATLKSRGRSGEDLELSLAGEPQANLVLLHALEDKHGITIEPDDLLAAGLEEGEEDDWALDAAAVFSYLSEQVKGLEGFEVQHRAILGNFSFQKMAMVRDLRRHREELVRHPLIAAIAGHQPSRDELSASARDLDPRELDHTPPDDEYLVLDADSSQHRAIALALGGQHGVIQGPPGTGKSQTIANLIAEFAAQGDRILFVAEKRAALEAVLKRLRERGLDHLALDLHGASISRKAVMARIADALQRIHESTPVDAEQAHREFEELRRRLNAHVERMHAPREPAGFSVHEIQGLLLRKAPEARSSVRWRGDQLQRLTREQAHNIRQLLTEAATLHTLFLGRDSSAWNGANLPTGENAEAAIDRARLVAHELWPEFDAALRDLGDELAFHGLPESLDEVTELLGLLDDIDRLRAKYAPDLWEQPLAELEAQLAPADDGLLASVRAFLSDGEFRAARQRIRKLRVERARVADLLAEVREARTLRERWGALSEAPVPSERPAEQDALSAATAALWGELDDLMTVVARKDLRTAPLSETAAYLRSLADDATTAWRLPRVHELREALTEAGMKPLLAELERDDVPPEAWADRFDYAWLRSVLDRAMAEDSKLATFDGRTHDGYVKDFIRLDEERIRLAADRVRRLHGEKAIAAMNCHPDQTDLVRREAHKRSRHKPLRRLLAEAPDVLTRIAPCWVASPLSVSQLLDGGTRHFDLVLFDEASQILPEEAVPSILRGEQVVVAGDRHQLPPTTFFAASLEEETDEELEAVSGFESLLDTAAVFLPNWLLEWHYRSRDERLIAFSNHHIYDDRLITFPSAGEADCIEHVLVPHDPGLSGQEESASPEVDEVVRRVIEHAEARPRETLGVITMGIRHANRIQEALDRELSLRPDLSAFFSLEREERFFVKNLERVQGDERDAIILSIGYGKSPDGTLPHRFGPLTHASGHRRLNVAVTRARRRMTVVSSFTHHDVDPSRSKSRGVKLLRRYLEYAASSGRQLPTSKGHTGVPLNPFEADIKDALEARGIPLIPQWGASRYRIDLVAKHPEKPGRLVLAIECDGSAYHSSPTARDRDRLRQQHLERLGWRFHRIWSTDWFTRREKEIERAWAAYQDAVRYADLVDEHRGSDVSEQPPEPEPEGGPPDPPPRRFRLPPIERKADITQYTRAELRYLAEWALSDGRLRTDEDLMRDMLEALGFQRLGSRIRERFERALADARERMQQAGG
jgi:very-short-patch-repair endonuclease